MRIVPINCITKETILAKTLYNTNGNVLLRKGTTITQSLIGKIKASDINTLYIDDGYSNVEIEDVIKPEIKNAALKTIKTAFSSIQGDIQKELDQSRPLHKRLKTKVMDKYIGNFKNISDLIIEDLMASHNLLINVIDIKHISDYEYEHSLHVAVLALITGMELRLNRHDLYCLFIGAILHDLGKVFLDINLLNRGDEKSEGDNEIYQTHTNDGYDYLKENHGLSATSKIVVLQHHEHFDGSGFPLGTSGNNIHKFSRIVSICNTYDKMTSESSNSPAIPPNEVIEYIMGGAGTLFDFDIATTFVRKINPYPIGTLLDLSNKKTAVVIDTNTNYPMRPVIQILLSTDSGVEKKEIIDLMEQTDITIKQIRYSDVTEEEKTFD